MGGEEEGVGVGVEEGVALRNMGLEAFEAQMNCLMAKVAHPEMFVSGFDVDEEGLEGPEDPGNN